MTRSAHIKLQKRHFIEWHTLITHQQQVWGLLEEETTHKLSAFRSDELAYFALKTEKATRLIRIMARQRKERQQIQWRHQQELVLLDQLIEKSINNSNGDITHI